MRAAETVALEDLRPKRPRTFEVSITKTRYAEDVVVELLRRRADGYYNVVGTVRQRVAKDGTAIVPFSYAWPRQR